jgi:hypothetical protein
MTTPDRPGWYDDPQDSGAQRYWDGQDWTPHRQRKLQTTKPQPTVAAPPPQSSSPPTPPPPSPVVESPPSQPPLPPPLVGGSSSWEQPPPPPTGAGDSTSWNQPWGQPGGGSSAANSGQWKIILGVVGVLAAIAVSLIAFKVFGGKPHGRADSTATTSTSAAPAPFSTRGSPPGFSTRRSAPGSSTRGSPPGFSTRQSPPEADSSSDSYKAGLDSGTKGLAEIEAFKGADYNDICEQSFEIDNALDLYNKQDYMAGCLYGLSHQSAQWTQTRK